MSKPSKIMKFMDSVKPTRIWIDGKCHVVSKYERSTKDGSVTEQDAEKFTKEYDINVVEDQYHTSFKLASIYYQKINTFNKITVEELEQDTGTKIKVPNEDAGDKIVIKGGKLEDVIDARLKLQSLVSAIRDKHTAMQFVAIPVHSEEVKEKFSEFKKALLSEENTIAGLHESIFQKPERLHLTIAVFALMDDVEKAEAVKALEECKAAIIEPLISKTGPLKIHVKGLDCMNDKYSKANILYANVKFGSEGDETSLQNTANSISNYFYDKGLVRQPQETVKLHVTLMNTKFRKNKKRWTKIPFDATTIMEKYKEFDFGTSDFNSVHLSHICIMDVNGFYKPLSTITV